MFHLAQVNIARARAPLTDPVMADFVAALDRINAAAEAAEGFVWRHTDDASGAASDAEAFGDPLEVVNLSTWRSIECLQTFVYRSEHLEPFRRRAEWFTRLDTPHLAMWWVPVGHRPTMKEARERLEHLAIHGESQTAFTFRQPHAAPAGPATHGSRPASAP